MAATLDTSLTAADTSSVRAPETQASGPAHAAPRTSNARAIGLIVLPRLLVAFVLSALLERSAAVGTAGPDIRGPAAGLMNWDAGHYLSIAEHGYRSVVDTPFFPGQPLAAHALGVFVGFPNADIAVSWIAFAFAVWGIVDVAGRLTTRRAGIAAGLLFAWNPASVFLVAGYAQSLSIALTVWSLRYALDRRWLPAALLAGAASAVIPQSALVGVMVVIGILLAERGIRRVVLAVGYGLVAEWGLIGYLLYSRDRFGNALEFQKAGATFWGNHLTYPLHSLVADLQSLISGGSVSWATGSFIRTVDFLALLAAVVVLLVIVVLAAKDRRWTLPAVLYILGATVNLCVISTWGDPGEARFMSALVTVWLVAAVFCEWLLRRHVLWLATAVAFSAGLAIYIEAQYHMVYWII